MNSLKEVNEKAWYFYSSNKYGYLYGAKNEPYTKALVDRLSKQYPSIYVGAIKYNAYSDINRFKYAIDCSGLVCECLGIPHIGSAQLFDRAIIKKKINRTEDIKNGNVLYKKGHVALVTKHPVTDMLIIIEAKGTLPDLTCVQLLNTSRYKDFTHILDFGIKPDSVNKQIYYKIPDKKCTSIVDALKSINIDSSFINRKKIANKNGIVEYIGTSTQNILLLNLLYKGKLKKV